jgi:hypothetical protein
VAITSEDRNGRDDISWPDFIDLRKNCGLVQAFVADRIFSTTLSIGTRAERAMGSVVSANYFHTLGVPPILGRPSTPLTRSGAMLIPLR